MTFGVAKLEWCGYSTVDKFDNVFSRLDTIPGLPACDKQTDRETDGRTSCDNISALCLASRSKKPNMDVGIDLCAQLQIMLCRQFEQSFFWRK